MSNISAQKVLKKTFEHLNKVVDEKKNHLENDNREGAESINSKSKDVQTGGCKSSTEATEVE